MQGKVKVLEGLIALQAGRLILWLPVMLGCGSALYFTLRAEPSGVLSAALTAVLVAAVFTARGLRDHHDWRRVLWLVVFLLLWVSAGFSLAQWRTTRLDGPALRADVRSVAIEGTVAEIEILPAAKGGQRVILRDLSIDKLSPADTPHRIRLRIRDNEHIPIGARVRGAGNLSAPSAPVMPRAFDFQRHAYFQQIGAYGYTFRPLEVIAPPKNNLGEGIVITFLNHTERIRQDIVARLDTVLSADSAAITAALMVGERGAISDDDNESMRISGLAHMLSISGMHVGMIAAVVFFTVRLLLAAFPAVALRYPIKKWAAIAALAVATFYTVLAVPSVPSYRSLLMCALVLFAVMIDRKPFSMRTVAIAAIIVLCITPEAVWSASFQMSFAATAALIFFFEETAPWWTAQRQKKGALRKVFLYLLAMCGTTLAASIATAPFAAYHFNQYASYSMLSNLLAVPVLNVVVMPFIVLAFLAMPLGMDLWILRVIEWGVDIILWISHFVSALPLSSLIVAAWPLSALLWGSVAMIIVMLWAGRARYVLCVACLGAMALSIAQYKQPDIIVSHKADLIAWRMPDGGLSLSSARNEKFAAGIWMRRNGQSEDGAHYWPREGQDEQSAMHCDPSGCRVQRAGRNIAFSLRPEGLREDCAWADILISRAPLREMPCKAGIVIDRFDVWRNGAHAVWITPDTQSRAAHVENVAVSRGRRPWTNTMNRYQTRNERGREREQDKADEP